MRLQESDSHPSCEPSPNGSVAVFPAALAESWGAQELAAALDAVGTGVWAVDLQGRCVFINREASRILGYTREECLGQRLQCTIHRGSADGWHCAKEHCAIQRALESGAAEWTDQEVFHRCDGTPFPVQFSVQPVIVQGRITGAVMSITDITSQKRAEEALRKSDEWLGFAQQASGVGIFDADLKTGEVRVSKGQFQIYGLDPAGTWPSNEEWLKLVHPEDREIINRGVELAISGGELPDREFRVVWSDGSIHWLFSHGKAFFDEAGTATRLVGTNVDITGRVRAETVLNQFFSASPTPMAIWELDGRIQQANSSWESILGYSAAELEGLRVSDMVHPEDQAAAAAEFEKLLIVEKLEGFECRARCKDGSYRWLLVNASVVGDARVIYATAHNITRRKRAEEAARRSEEWLRFTLSAAGIGLCYRESGETRASEEQFRLYGLEPADKWISREQWLQLIHPEDRERVETEQRPAIEQGKPYDIQFRVVWPNGSIRWLLCRGKLFREGREARKTEITVDVTERERAEATLDKFFNMSSSPMGIFGFDGMMKRVNGAVLRASGFTAEEFAERPLTAYFHPDDRAMMQAELQNVIAQGGETEFECRGVCKDGSIVWLVLSATAAQDEKLLFTVAHDITERKAMAEALVSNAEKLTRSNEELERFAYVASHDLQEPLRMVASFTQLLGRRYAGKLDETADRYIHYAVDGATRMQELITDLLSYSRMNSKELDIRQTDAEAVVRGAMRNLHVAIEDSGASVTLDPLPALCVDQAQFVQVFQNLLANAIKFRQKQEPPRIRVSAVDTGADWTLSIRDNGIGIEPRHAARLFQMFQRLHTRAEYPGTGIGLAVCQKVIERHGGRIWVESEPGTGSTFLFTIPKSSRRKYR